MPSMVSAIGVSFEFPNGRPLFTNLNFSIPRGIIGLIGRNGVGKSTLAQLILGDLSPQQGTITRTVSVGFFAQIQTPLSVSVEQFLGSDYEWSHLKEQLIGAIDRQKLCSQLSGGNWSFYESMREVERENISDQLAVAEKNRDLTKKQRHLEIEKQDKRNHRGVRAAERGGMPKILIGGRKRRAQVTTGKIDVQTITKSNQAVTDAHLALQELKLNPIMYEELKGEKIPNQKLVAEAVNFNVCYKDWVFGHDLNFCWRGSMRLILRGKNGSGKTTLLKALFDPQNRKHRGQLRFGQLKTLYVDQNCSSLNLDLTVLETILDAFGGIESEIRNKLAKFLFESDSVFQKVATLSGGERLRLSLAQGLLQHEKPQLMVLDEPTNNLDLTNIKFLEKMVHQFEGALIIISHDDVFIKNCNMELEFDIISS